MHIRPSAAGPMMMHVPVYIALPLINEVTFIMLIDYKSISSFLKISFSLIGDSLGVAQFVFATMWFKPTELSRVFGLTLSFSRMVSIPVHCKNYSVTVTLFGVNIVAVTMTIPQCSLQIE